MRVNNDGSKWASRSAGAAGEYEKGTSNPRRPWAASTAAAADAQAQGVQNAIAEKRFEKGVNRAGDGAWSAGVRDKGRTRFQTGVSVAGSKYQNGFAPFAAVLSGLNLNARGPKGTNYGRVQQVGEALQAAKKAQ